MTMPYIPESAFAGWMAAWADRVSDAPGWRELTHYRGLSAMDCGYAHLYFRVLDQIRPMLDPDARASHPAELSRQSIKARLAFRLRMTLPPLRLPRPIGPGRAALVLTASPNATAFPVLEALRDDCRWRLLIASWSRNVETSARAGNLEYFHLADTYGRRYMALRRKHQAEIQREMEQLPASDLAAMFADIAGRPLPSDFTNFVKHACLEVRTLTDLYIDLFSRTAPAALILFSELTLRERPAARVAAQMGIKTVTLMHGIFIGHVYRSLATDRMVVWGRIPRDFTLARGCAPEAVISAGGFGHEEWLVDMSTAARETPALQRTVLLLGQNPAAFISPKLYEESIRIVCETARRLPDARFVVRPHPAESRTAYERAVQSNSIDNLEVGAGSALKTTLQCADVVLTVFSTAGLEAMLVGKPVVVLNPVSEPPLAPYARCVPVARDVDSLTDTIRQLLEKPEYRSEVIRDGTAFARDYFGPIEGASRRAARSIDAFLASASDTVGKASTHTVRTASN
jgi:hypothetical protein